MNYQYYDRYYLIILKNNVSGIRFLDEFCHILLVLEEGKKVINILFKPNISAE